VGDRDRLPLAREQDEQSPGVEPREGEHPGGDRIEAVKGVQEPAVDTGGAQRIPELAGIRNHS
jgi:hypothetical protein